MGILRISLLIMFGFLASFNLQAQVEKTIDAFEKSYTSETEGDFTKAIQELKMVYSETSYPVNLRLAWLSYSAGLFTESMAFYNKAIKLMPYSIEARLGICYPGSAIGNWDLVITSYQGILEIDVKNYTANYKLASIYYGQKSYVIANKYLETIVNLYPFNYNSTLLYAWNQFKLGKTREAKLLFNKCLLLSPEDPSALEGLSLINQ